MNKSKCGDDEDCSLASNEEDETPILFGLNIGKEMQKKEEKLPANYKKALSKHGPEHPFHLLSPRERNATDPNSSFIASDFYEVPLNT